MADSTIPAFRRGLYNRLAADTTLAGQEAQLSVGDPYPDRPRQKLVMILATQNEEPPSLMGGAGLYVKYESYQTELMVSVLQHNREDELTLEESAWSIAETVCTSIRSWALPANGPWGGITVPSGAQINWIIVQSRRLEAGLNGDVREARVMVTLDCKATI